MEPVSKDRKAGEDTALAGLHHASVAATDAYVRAVMGVGPRRQVGALLHHTSLATTAKYAAWAARRID
jgi:hypothetical protein